MKTCTGCNRDLSPDCFRSRVKKQNGKEYPYTNSQCRECEAAYAREHGRSTRWAAQKRWVKLHPEKRRDLARPHDAMRRKATRAWYRQHREEQIAMQQKRYLARADEIRARRRARYIENRETEIHYGRERRHRLRANGGNGVTAKQWEQILTDFGHECAYCSAPATEMDHVMPLSRGGEHDVGNVVPACRSCNSSKRARTVEEWLYGAKVA